MRRGWFAALTLSLTLACLFAASGARANAEDNAAAKEAELRGLLQKGLTIQEIDRELEKLAAKDERLAADMQVNEQRIELSRTEMTTAKEKAGKVLRSYYTGDRPSIIMLLLTTESFTDLLKMLDYMNMIVTHDNRMLNAYKESYNKLQTLQVDLSRQREELQRTKNDYLAQKERIVTLQAELDTLLAASGNRDEYVRQIGQLNEQWKTVGIPLFDRYLTQLGVSFKRFSELLSTDSFKMTSLNTADFDITDKQLNDFLRSTNHLFDHLNFRFAQGLVIAEGKEDGVDVSIKGVYKMAGKVIKFELLGLTFNGFDLPDTTVKSMNESYSSLGIDPSKVAAFLTPEDVVITDGKLTVKLKLSF
jgi:peptidoglycan hydrolase CwlO-like protein